MGRTDKKIFITFGLLIISLLIYSYSQIDLNLTLSSNSVYQQFQSQLIQLGYFHRTASASIYLVLILLLFIFYFLVMKKVEQKKISPTSIKWLMGISLILIFAYPAFSHDIFNYMFDAKIVTKYGLSPYFFKALDFPNDTWTRFMHWTHRYYPYGPGWLILSLIPSYLGLGKFVLTLGLFKVLFALFHCLNCYLINKIVKKLYFGQENLATVFYGLNPLVLIESLLSPHNEVIMLTLVLVSIYLFLSKKGLLSMMSLVISISIKYLSIVMLPLIIWKKNRPRQFLLLSIIIWSLCLIPVILQRTFYPWYFVPLVGLTAVAMRHFWLELIFIGLSGGALMLYWPYLLFGDYGPKTYLYQQWSIISIFIMISISYYLLWQKKFHI